MLSLSDRVVLLTGAAGGIGRCLARTLSAQGARLALVDRDAEGLRSVVAELSGPASAHIADLSQTGGFDDLVAQVVAQHGRIDVLICNAGLTIHAPFSAMRLDEIDRVMDVDLRGVLHLVHHCLPHLRASDDAHIVLISSMAGLQAFPFQSIYSAAKHGLRGYGEALRMELGAVGIGVTTVLPGTIATGFMDDAGDHSPERLAQLASLMKRFGTSPQRVATKTVRGVLRNHGRVRVGWDCYTVSFVQWIAPPVLPLLLAWSARRELMGSK